MLLGDKFNRPINDLFFFRSQKIICRTLVNNEFLFSIPKVVGILNCQNTFPLQLPQYWKDLTRYWSKLSLDISSGRDRGA